MSNATPEPKRCEICGTPLRRDNKSGLCGNPKNVECTRERARRTHAERPQKSRREPDGGRKRCEVCGGPLNRDNMMGVCSGKGSNSACAKERGRRQRQGKVPSRDPLVIPGQVFGKWTTLEGCTFGEDSIWCNCECGNKRRVRARELAIGASRDCGCAWRANGVRTRSPDPYIQAGAVFDRLTLLEDARHSHDKPWCRCECGREGPVRARDVKGGRSRSCGCLIGEIRRTHGLSKHPLYNCWHSMLIRCTNPDSRNWEGYGGRGIGVCDRWFDLRLFVEDIERDLGPRPKGMSLDRIDNELGYGPDNVRWANGSTQRTNQRTVKSLTRERDAALARAAELEVLLAACTCRDTLF